MKFPNKIVTLVRECCDVDSVLCIDGKIIKSNCPCSCKGEVHISCFLKYRMIENDYSEVDWDNFNFNSDSLVSLLNEANDKITESNGYIVFRLV